MSRDRWYIFIWSWNSVKRPDQGCALISGCGFHCIWVGDVGKGENKLWITRVLNQYPHEAVHISVNCERLIVHEGWFMWLNLLYFVSFWMFSILRYISLCYSRYLQWMRCLITFKLCNALFSMHYLDNGHFTQANSCFTAELLYTSFCALRGWLVHSGNVVTVLGR